MDFRVSKVQGRFSVQQSQSVPLPLPLPLPFPLPFSLLFLQLDRDTSHRTSLNPLHQMRDIACYLVAKFLAGDNGDLLAHALVGVEVISQARVVLLDDDPGRLLHSLGANAALKVERVKSLGRPSLPWRKQAPAPGGAGEGRTSSGSPPGRQPPRPPGRQPVAADLRPRQAEDGRGLKRTEPSEANTYHVGGSQ